MKLLSNLIGAALIAAPFSSAALGAEPTLTLRQAVQDAGDCLIASKSDESLISFSTPVDSKNYQKFNAALLAKFSSCLKAKRISESIRFSPAFFDAVLAEGLMRKQPDIQFNFASVSLPKLQKPTVPDTKDSVRLERYQRNLRGYFVQSASRCVAMTRAEEVLKLVQTRADTAEELAQYARLTPLLKQCSVGQPDVSELPVEEMRPALATEVMFLHVRSKQGHV